jgi:hypothetical protein
MQREWIYEALISQSDLLLFYNSISCHKNPFIYRPIALAKRDEVGTKYRFLCIAQSDQFPGHSSHFANIEIYKPEKGMPYTTRIHRINFDQFT